MKKKTLFITLGCVLAVACVVVVLLVTGVFEKLTSEGLLGSSGVKEITLTAMGDSLPGGYSLPGYVSDEEPLETRFVDIFAKKVSAAKVNRLAVSGSASIHAVMQLIVEDNQLPTVNTVNNAITQEQQDAYLKELVNINNGTGTYADNKYTQAIKESSIIIFNSGSNDLVGPMYETILSAAGTSSTQELADKIKELMDDSKILEVGNLLKNINTVLHKDETYAKLDKAVENYGKNFEAVITAINKINPNATIIVLNNYNPYAGFAYSYNMGWGPMEIINVDDISTKYINQINESLANCSVKDLFTIVDIKNLDRSMTNVVLDVDNGKIDIDPHPNTDGHKYIAELVFDAYDVIKNARASVEVKGRSDLSKRFSNISKAWAYADSITNYDVTIYMLEDWNATSFGSGTGFSSAGGFAPSERTTNLTTLTIEGNGHTIKLNLEMAKENGSVFTITGKGTYVFNNVKISGGNTSGNGGGLFINNSQATVKLNGVTVTGNKATNGGGAYVGSNGVLELTDSTVENNTATGQGGGIFTDGNTPCLNLYGLVKIQNNSGQDKYGDLVLNENSVVKYCELTAGSNIMINKVYSGSFPSDGLLLYSAATNNSLIAFADFVHCSDTGMVIDPRSVNMFGTYFYAAFMTNK